MPITVELKVQVPSPAKDSQPSEMTEETAILTYPDRDNLKQLDLSDSQKIAGKLLSQGYNLAQCRLFIGKENVDRAFSKTFSRLGPPEEKRGGEEKGYPRRGIHGIRDDRGEPGEMSNHRRSGYAGRGQRDSKISPVRRLPCGV